MASHFRFNVYNVGHFCSGCSFFPALPYKPDEFRCIHDLLRVFNYLSEANGRVTL